MLHALFCLFCSGDSHIHASALNRVTFLFCYSGCFTHQGGLPPLQPIKPSSSAVIIISFSCCQLSPLSESLFPCTLAVRELMHCNHSYYKYYIHINAQLGFCYPLSLSLITHFHRMLSIPDCLAKWVLIAVCGSGHCPNHPEGHWICTWPSFWRGGQNHLMRQILLATGDTNAMESVLPLSCFTSVAVWRTQYIGILIQVVVLLLKNPVVLCASSLSKSLLFHWSKQCN